jgi:hypothetical protein
MNLKGLVNKKAIREYIISRNWRYNTDVIDKISAQMQRIVDNIYTGNLSDEQTIKIKTNENLEQYENGFKEGYDKGFLHGLNFKNKR